MRQGEGKRAQYEGEMWLIGIEIVHTRKTWLHPPIVSCIAQAQQTAFLNKSHRGDDRVWSVFFKQVGKLRTHDYCSITCDTDLIG